MPIRRDRVIAAVGAVVTEVWPDTEDLSDGDDTAVTYNSALETWSLPVDVVTDDGDLGPFPLHIQLSDDEFGEIWVLLRLILADSDADIAGAGTMPVFRSLDLEFYAAMNAANWYPTGTFRLHTFEDGSIGLFCETGVPWQEFAPDTLDKAFAGIHAMVHRSGADLIALATARDTDEAGSSELDGV